MTGAERQSLAAAAEQPKTQLPRVALLTNIIPPYRKPLYAALQEHCTHLRILVSVRMEPNRHWRTDWDGLDVKLQKTLSITRISKHPEDLDEFRIIHLPVDTVFSLWQYDAEIVISHEMGFRTLLALVYRKIRRKTKLVVWACVTESIENQRGWGRTQLRRLLRNRIDGFIVNGASGVRYLKSLGVAEQNIFKAPYCTDSERFSRVAPVRRLAEARRLLYVGQLVERKGLLPFLTILAEWATANPEVAVEFTIAGQGPLARVLAQTPLPANLSLEYLGWISYEDLTGIYQSAGVFAFPTLADEWGIVVNEAMATGLPVLGSLGAQSVEELVREGQSGWLFRPNSPQEIYEAIDRCMNTPLHDLERMRLEARSTALRLTPEYVAERLAQAVAQCRNGASAEVGRVL